jgi:hypothetical protein
MRKKLLYISVNNLFYPLSFFGEGGCALQQNFPKDLIFSVK